jgi:hypothetical protein
VTRRYEEIHRKFIPSGRFLASVRNKRVQLGIARFVSKLSAGVCHSASASRTQMEKNLKIFVSRQRSCFVYAVN